MNRQFYDKVFSNERMYKYFLKYPDDEQKAIMHYHLNVELSESFYPALSMFEVALRNSLNRELIEFFGTADWFDRVGSTVGLRSLRNDIHSAKKHIINRGGSITTSKMIAELTLGFWVKLFNVEYERVLWKQLRKAFPYIEKEKRQRHNISAPINKIRNFRNRVFHHEPIAWNLDELQKLYNGILEVTEWLNRELPNIIKKTSRVPDIINKAVEILK